MTIRVLLVDDEPLTLELHRAFVERLAGFVVAGECATARAAVTAIVERPGEIDLVLLDMTMPDGTGLDVLRHIRARASSVDVIAITAVRDAELVRSTASLGVAQYLVKPFTFRIFQERMRQYEAYRAQAAKTAGPATQAEIDALLSALRPSTAVELPKGLSAPTVEKVSDALRAAAGPLSAQQIADALEMGRTSARRYLEHLADVGRVDREHRYGTRGRPVTEYRWHGGTG